MWEFLNSKPGLLVIGFILTTLSGGLISSWLQRQSWKRQSRVELYRTRYDEGTEFLNDLSKLIGNRFFYLQRFLWAIREDDADRLTQAELDYFRVVADWNSTFWMNRNKIRLLIGERQANLFLDYDDDFRRDDPQSLHYKFVKAHLSVVAAKKKQQGIEDTQVDVYEVNHFCSNFLEMLTTDFLKRAASLQLLEVPQDNVANRKSTMSDNPHLHRGEL